MLRCNLTMVGEDANGPAFIEEVEEFAKIIIGLLIKVFHPFFCQGHWITVYWQFSQMLDEHMFFKINGMEVREYHFNVFIFDHVMKRFCLPIGGGVPAI